MASKGRAYIPLDLRGRKKIEDAITIALDEDVPGSASLNLYTDTMNLDVLLDEEALTVLFDRVLAARLVLARDRGEKKGSENAARRRQR
jgi:hypothetical protein